MGTALGEFQSFNGFAEIEKALVKKNHLFIYYMFFLITKKVWFDIFLVLLKHDSNTNATFTQTVLFHS